jgi:hypothetical protein
MFKREVVHVKSGESVGLKRNGAIFFAMNHAPE